MPHELPDPQATFDQIATSFPHRLDIYLRVAALDGDGVSQHMDLPISVFGFQPLVVWNHHLDKPVVVTGEAAMELARDVIPSAPIVDGLEPSDGPGSPSGSGDDV